MRRLFVLPLLAATFLLAPAAAWAAPSKLLVEIEDLYGWVSGTTDAGLRVDVTLKGPGGAAKATAHTVADASGRFETDVGEPLESGIDAGDTLVIVLGENPEWTYSSPCSSLDLTAIDLATGVLSGRISPRQLSVSFRIDGQRVVPSADPAVVAEQISVMWRTPPLGKRTAPDGSFKLRPVLTDGSWVFRPARGDEYRISYQTFPVPSDPVNFVFTHSDAGNVPGLEGFVGGFLFGVAGPSLDAWEARLLNPAGTVKARGSVVVETYGHLAFYNRAGEPVAAVSGDTIRILGPLGFSARVPRLQASVDPATNSVSVLGPPNRFVGISLSLFGAAGEALPAPPASWVRTDATGRATKTFDASVTLHAGDIAQLMLRDRAGNRWLAEAQALP